ncbi:hypothetical protein MKW94_019405 [Papaver nudicaule]|uniref:Fatty acid desaturase domain-containing protein n=1 Tax=Papaver nudicaule TaxID=74823 RepID=A0AA41VBS3_PAPNU|nr:hypothetical protein [Papaver nudicaule]
MAAGEPVNNPKGVVVQLQQTKNDQLVRSKRKLDRIRDALNLGISLSYHRNLTHKSFKLTKSLEYLFAYFGLHAAQGDPIFWVSIHRYHHQFTDTARDPHSPIEGFWFSHTTWIFQHTHLREKVRIIP